MTAKRWESTVGSLQEGLILSSPHDLITSQRTYVLISSHQSEDFSVCVLEGLKHCIYTTSRVFPTLLSPLHTTFLKIIPILTISLASPPGWPSPYSAVVTTPTSSPRRSQQCCWTQIMFTLLLTCPFRCDLVSESHPTSSSPSLSTRQSHRHLSTSSVLRFYTCYFSLI
jgi:hypothetical protein